MTSQIKITKDLDKVWFTADNHFGHENIIEYCNRPFKTVEEMDTKLIDNWNDVVRSGDTVYHLGDFCLGNGNLADVYFNQLNGQIKILCNPWHHDTRWLGRKYISADGAEVMYLLPLVSLKVKRPEVPSLYIMLCHYPLASWDRSHYGSLHLHGHCHGNLLSSSENLLVRTDVGVDVQDYYPVSLNSILEMTADG